MKLGAPPPAALGPQNQDSQHKLSQFRGFGDSPPSLQRSVLRIVQSLSKASLHQKMPLLGTHSVGIWLLALLWRFELQASGERIPGMDPAEHSNSCAGHPALVGLEGWRAPLSSKLSCQSVFQHLFCLQDRELSLPTGCPSGREVWKETS